MVEARPVAKLVVAVHQAVELEEEVHSVVVPLPETWGQERWELTTSLLVVVRLTLVEALLAEALLVEALLAEALLVEALLVEALLVEAELVEEGQEKVLVEVEGYHPLVVVPLGHLEKCCYTPRTHAD